MPEIDTFDEQFDLAIDELHPSTDPEAPAPDRSRDIYTTTGEDLNTFEAKAKFSGVNQQAFAEVLSRGQLYNKSAEQLIEESQDIVNKQREFSENPEYVTEQALAQINPDYSSLEARTITNYQIAQEITSNLMEETRSEGTSWFTYGSDFLGRYIFRQLPIGTYEDFTGRTERKGMEILSKATALSPKDFRVWMQDYADEVGREGFLSDKNLFAAMTLQEEVSNLGFDPGKELTRILTVLDIPSPAAFLKAGKLAAKVGSSLKSTTAIGRVTAVAGDDAGQAAAEGTLAKSADPETLGVVGDAATDLNAAGTPVRPSSVPFVQRMRENAIIQEMDHIWKQGGFGRTVSVEKIKEVAQNIAADYSAKINHVIHSGAQIVDEGLGIYVAKFKVGKPDSGAVFEPVAYRAGLDGKRVDVDLAEEAGTVGGRAVGPDGVRVPGATRLSQLDEVGEAGGRRSIPPEVKPLKKRKDEITEELKAIDDELKDLEDAAAGKFSQSAQIASAWSTTDLGSIRARVSLLKKIRLRKKQEAKDVDDELNKLGIAEEAGTVGGRRSTTTIEVNGVSKTFSSGARDTEAAAKVETKYQPPESVIRMAEKIGPNAKVVQFDPSDASKGYLIEVSERIDTLGLPDAVSDQMWEATNLSLVGRIVRNTVGRLLNNEITTSAAVRDNERLTVLAQLGQGGRAAVKEIVRPYEKAIKAVDSKAEYTIRAVYTQLRDGPDASRRVRYTESEFKAEYQKLHPTKAEATQKEVDAYNALATVEEADYILKATKETQRYIAKGYNRAVDVGEGIFVPAKRIEVSALKEGEVVRTVEGRIYGTIDEILDEVPEGLPVWKLDKPLETGERYVIQPISSRIIEPSDVMGYNPGGTRVNPFANYFLVIGDKGTRLKSLLSSFTQADSLTAFKQLTAIKKAIDSGAVNIDDIIKANNDWNPGIQTKAAFDQFAYESGWVKNKGDKLEGELATKLRDDDIIEGDLDNTDIWAGVKTEDYVQNDMRRNDKVLPDFGGGKAYNEDPVSAIFSQFGSSVFAYSNRAYTQNAMVGWVKAAQDQGRNWFGPPGAISKNDYETLFRIAKVTSDDDFSRRMNEMRNITLRRLDMQDEASDHMNKLGDRAAQYVFDGKLPFGVMKGKKLDIGDPTNGLLKVGFQSAFGFLNVSQFFMQGLHATTVMAISPVHGFKGAAMTFTQRGLLSAVKDPATYKEGIKRFAKAHDLTEETAEELMEYIRTSGRHIVDGDAIEAGTGIGWLLSGWRGQNLRYSAMKARVNELKDATGKGLEAGLYPFKAGERLSRLTAINTAFLEFKKANPNVSAMSDRGRSWITSREQTLTFNMTTVDKAKVQSSLMKVPTQWLSYSMRSMEAVFVGRGLSEGERLRLFAILGPMYGLSGFGLASSADYIGEKLGIEPDSSLYSGLKYGVIDGLSQHLVGDVGGAVGVGQRLAPIGAFVDTYKKVTEEGSLQTLGGPSGEISYNILVAAFNAMDNLANGHTVAMTEDLIKVIRQPSALNNYAKAIGIVNNGIYRGKSGLAVGDTMGINEALISGLGFTPLKVQEIYNRRGQANNSKRQLTSFRKEINNYSELAYKLIDAGGSDRDRGFEMLNEISDKIALSGFAWSDQVSLRKSAMTRLENDWPKMAQKLLKQEKSYAVIAAEGILYPEENN